MQAAMGNAVDCVLSLFLIALVGFILARRQWFSADFKVLLPRLVTIVTLPPYLFKNIVATFDREELVSLIGGVAVPVISILLTFSIGLGLSKLTRMRRDRAGIFSTTFAASNTIFIGLPVNIALFGEAALPHVLLYFFANTLFFWTIGNYQFSLGGDRAPEKIISRSTLKRLFSSPPLVGFALGLLAVLTDLRPPRFIMEAAGQIGALTTPLAIIFIGLTLASASLKNLIPDRDVWLLLLGRFVISPLTVILLIRIMPPIPPLMARVFIIQSSLPAVVSATLLAGYYNSDAKFASTIVSLTTLLSLATIPIYMAIISCLNFR